VARACAARGWVVRGLIRASSPRANVADFPGDLAEGDMRDAAAVERALGGCDALLHVAADYRLWARNPQSIIDNNRLGAEAVCEAALRAGTPRIVYTSSVATIAPMPDGSPAGEDRPLSPEQAIGAYKRGKVIAERLVEQCIADRGLPAVIVNPSTPIGPRDVKPTPTGRIIVEAAAGRMPAFVETGLNLVHVDDVAEGHCLALEKGVVGQRYILGGTDVPLSEYLAEIARQVGRNPPTLKLPVGPLRPLAAVAEAWGQLTGREPMLTADALKMARHHMYFSSERAERELGYTHRDWREGVADALGWFRARGMVK
jgi:hopanoid-associated sugar epimerase